MRWRRRQTEPAVEAFSFERRGAAVATPAAVEQARLPGQRVTFTRRFFGDSLLEALLMVITLYIGWFIWLSVVARKGQTPAKSILNVYIHDYKTGAIAKAPRVWQREVVGKLAVPWIILIVVGLAGPALGPYAGYIAIALEVAHPLSPIVVLWTRDRRAVWDLHSGTVVRYHPGGIERWLAESQPNAGQRLEELEGLWRRGYVTRDEYEEKRREIIARL